ncbi:diguanylate cyclase [Desulfurispirillum indicum S5]|uniref:Diguanylate cyclase n=1 Tax=Desulfurispirillum indicum (strain ATCC BAA-1389 / DSM 22839 / S5) TaxID=653733 RepID=E6W1Q1_DESIS|nr:EAL domain-containing protein [Desulfurispirillum indicum]ADU66600.1 diguanylate cyclase [Desulfurispirillum indicum S5]
MPAEFLARTERRLFRRILRGFVLLIAFLAFGLSGFYSYQQLQLLKQYSSDFKDSYIDSQFALLREHLQREVTIIRSELLQGTFDPAMTLERLRQHRIGPRLNGYFFALEVRSMRGGPDFARHLLLPIDPSQVGVPMDSSLQDKHGFAYREVYLQQLRETGTARVTYWYEKPDAERTVSEKTSYLVLLPELDWIIGAGLYLDDIEEVIASHTHQQRQRLLASFVFSVLITAVFIVAALYFAWNYNLNLMSLLRSLRKQIQDREEKLVALNNSLQNRVDQAAVELERQYLVDALTGMGNRARLARDLAFVRSPRTFCLVDVDGFREINEIFGISSGDILLQELARRIQECCEGGVVYRFSGDNFVVLCPRVEDSALSRYLETLHDCLVDNSHTPPAIADVQFNVTVVGTNEASNPLGRLEMTMHHAKAQRRNTLCYSEEFNAVQRYRQNIAITQKIRQAIDEDSVFPVFQPICDLQSCEITKYECLMRIRHGDEVLSPGEFLSVAQRSKLYPRLVGIMLRKSFAAFANNHYMFSINLSYADIVNEDIRQSIMDLLTPHNAARVIFEILESEGIDNYGEVSRFIQQVKELGCKVAIDDFGSGYSNFEHIMKLQVDYIKLDGSLVHGLRDDPRNLHIVESIVFFAGKVGIHIVAEFVSEQELVEIVRRLGIAYAQGYAIGRPEPELLLQPPFECGNGSRPLGE